MLETNFRRSQTEACIVFARRLRTGDFRDYGTARWDGGDPACDHVKGRGGNLKNSVHTTRGGANQVADAQTVPFLGDCRKCGAVRIDSQIGLESSPDAYVSSLVEVFRGVRRVLRDDGVCWLNLGDTYVGGGRGGNPDDSPFRKQATNVGSLVAPSPVPLGLKPKDLTGIPWRVAFALQADGWYLRSDVIWAKRNCMPESVTDRPTKSHEYVFLLTKNERYWYDADAIREPLAESTLRQIEQGYDGKATKAYEEAGVQNPSAVKARIIGNRSPARARPESEFGANARTVWHLPTEPSPLEHFAVMPRALARKCILAGSPFGGVVLDPFAGVATTGVVALEEGRSFVGVELSPKYHAMARELLANVAPLLATEVPA